MKNLEFTIRPAALEDAEKIYDLLNDVGAENTYFLLEPDERAVEQITVLVHQQTLNRSLLLVAENNGVIVGVLGFIGGGFGKITNVIEIGLAIGKDFRKSGIGSTLFREAIA